MGGDPINDIDPSGGFLLGADNLLGAALGGATLGAIGGGIISAATGGDFFKGAAIGAGVGIGAALLPQAIKANPGAVLNITKTVAIHGATLGLNSMAHYANFGDWFRTFSPQSTVDIKNSADARGFWGDHYNNYNYPAVTRLGRIYQDAVSRSLGLEENWEYFGQTRPDLVAELPSRAVEFGSGYVKGYSFPNAAFIDVKFMAMVKFTDQIKNMINYLSNEQGGWEVDSRYGTRWRGDIKATDYNAATLILITPSNTVIDPEIVNYARMRKVSIIQEYTEKDISNPSRLRVAGFGTDLTNGGSVEMSKYFSSGSVELNWNVK